MPTCPRCHVQVQATAIQCPRCRLTLKAHGHPGIPLHQRADGEVLCTDCQYHADDSCTFPQRPLATTCTLYQSVSAPATVPVYRSPRPSLRLWLQRHGKWGAIALLLLISLAIALS
jgi:C4-type Zn-finger protein